MKTETTTIEVRRAETAEYGNVERFYRELIDSMRDSEYKPDWEMGVYPTVRMLKDAITRQTLYLAYLGSNLVGAMVLNHDCESAYENVKWHINANRDEVMVIHLLGVSPAHQGKGVASQMVSNAIEICVKSKMKAMRLDVLLKNKPAAKLYLSMGFQYVDSVQLYYEDTGLADFQLYELVLNNHAS